MAGLLVSVRSSVEAWEAVAGGATIVDVKEPGRGPLGRADAATWAAVRRAVPPDRPVSVALGELTEWDATGPDVRPGDFAALAFRKVGLSGLGRDPAWPSRWSRLRAALGDGPPWIAALYADHDRAGSPRPESVLEAALDARSEGVCAGLLLDTWDKSRPGPLAASTPWLDLVARAREGGLLVALAGGLDLADFERLAPLAPDLFAVRGAACRGRDRLGPIDRRRVARLVRAAGAVD